MMDAVIYGVTDNAKIDIDTARKELTEEAKSLGVEVNLMNEKVFTEMHRI